MNPQNKNLAIFFRLNPLGVANSSEHRRTKTFKFPTWDSDGGGQVGGEECQPIVAYSMEKIATQVPQDDTSGGKSV